MVVFKVLSREACLHSSSRLPSSPPSPPLLPPPPPLPTLHLFGPNLPPRAIQQLPLTPCHPPPPPPLTCPPSPQSTQLSTPCPAQICIPSTSTHCPPAPSESTQPPLPPQTAGFPLPKGNQRGQRLPWNLQSLKEKWELSDHMNWEVEYLSTSPGASEWRIGGSEHGGPPHLSPQSQSGAQVTWNWSRVDFQPFSEMWTMMWPRRWTYLHLRGLRKDFPTRLLPVPLNIALSLYLKSNLLRLQ